MENKRYWLSRTNCVYRGEGNSSLVICLKEEGKVIRLRKEEPNKMIKLSQGSIHDELNEQVEYCRNVMQPLLGSSFVHNPELILLSADEVQIINQVVEGCRSAERLHKSILEGPTHALVLPDYCSLPSRFSKFQTAGPVIAVEIKLKQGFLPSRDILPMDQKIKATVCHFCMKQYTKKHHGTIKQISGYCPIDLFSGCPIRMHHALVELINSPQNNFKLFKDQQLVFPEAEKLNLADIFQGDFLQAHCENDEIEENFFHLLLEALLKQFPVNETVYINTARKNCSERNYCEGKQLLTLCSSTCCQSHSLPKGCTLERILRIQQLDTLDVIGTREIYKAWITKYYHNNSEAALSEWKSQWLPHTLGGDQMLTESELEFYRRKIWEFLTALTVKDCSVMIAFRQLLEKSETVLDQDFIKDLQGNKYVFSIAVADLDSKGLQRIEQAYYKDCENVSAYISARK